jgi:hypothetical protein
MVTPNGVDFFLRLNCPEGCGQAAESNTCLIFLLMDWQHGAAAFSK